MTALSLKWLELGIGANVYGGLDDLSYPEATGQRLVFVPSYSTSFPTQELGHGQPSIAGVMSLSASLVPEFIADVRDGSAERAISFLMGDMECYGYAKSGDITSNKCVNFRVRGEGVRRIHYVGFNFPLTRSTIYDASDDTVLWGDDVGVS